MNYFMIVFATFNSSQVTLINNGKIITISIVHMFRRYTHNVKFKL